MTLKTIIQQEGRRVRRQIAALRTAENDSFVAGQRKYLGDESLPILVAPAIGTTVLVALGEAHVPALVQDLACGVFRGEELVAVARTGGSGMFAVRLEPGEYRLRFVNEVHDAADEEVLRRLGDRLAKEQLRAASVDVGPRVQVPPRWAALSRADTWLVHESEVVLCAQHADELPAPQIQIRNTAVPDEHGNIRVRADCDDAGNIVTGEPEKLVVPFAVVLVETQELATGRIVGNKLVPLPLYHGRQGKRKYRSAIVALRDVAGEVHPHAVESNVYLASENNLSKFCQHAKELEALAASPEVAYNDELSENVAALLGKVAELCRRQNEGNEK